PAASCAACAVNRGGTNRSPAAATVIVSGRSGEAGGNGLTGRLSRSAAPHPAPASRATTQITPNTHFCGFRTWLMVLYRLRGRGRYYDIRVLHPGLHLGLRAATGTSRRRSA